ncbi:MAG: arsenate reductase ArsC [Candidatus Thiodiazotropha sp.]
MTKEIYNVLFLCTTNSVRSIMGERLIDRFGQGRFHGFSAGSKPSGEVHPMTLEVLRHNNYITEDLRSKDWSEFASEDAPEMDFVFTVCDDVAAETCPKWPGQPMTAHWSIADPTSLEGNVAIRMIAFRRTLFELENRIKIFVSLPLVSLDRLKLQEGLDEISRKKEVETHVDRV